MGFAARVSLDRAWRDKGPVRSGTTYLGPELVVSLSPVILSTGVSWRLAGPAGPSARWSWNVGLGF
jgi:hypothetical protein